jgi:hypothetical protein
MLATNDPNAQRREQRSRGEIRLKIHGVAVVTFQGSKIKERGVTFAIVKVQEKALLDEAEPDRMITAFQNAVFGRIPVVLMAQDSQGIPTYYGRADIVRFLSTALA